MTPGDTAAPPDRAAGARESPIAAPFHLAFFVHDLASTRQFYGKVLGCREGRSTDSWVDFDFFGNQISAHRARDQAGAADEPGWSAASSGTVDSIEVPMPHFGAILSWDHFRMIAASIRAAKVPFAIEPTTRYAGQPSEQATMFVLDPSGNALEFKSFRNPEHTFTE